jgi:ABC-type multidrug transport system permease subunit
MLGLSNTSYQFFIYAITVIVTGLTGRALGIMMGAIFKDAAAATSVGNFLLIPLLMFSGVLSPLDSISPVVSWMQYISPFKYCF